MLILDPFINIMHLSYYKQHVYLYENLYYAALKKLFPHPPGGLSCPIFHFLHGISSVWKRWVAPVKWSVQLGTPITLCDCHSEASPTCDRLGNESPFIGLLHHVCRGSLGSTALCSSPSLCTSRIQTYRKHFVSLLSYPNFCHFP